MGLILILGVVAAAVIAVLLPTDHLIAGMQGGDFIATAAYGLIAVALLSSLVHRYRGRLGAGLRDALLWMLIFGVLVTAYAYRDLLEPVRQRVLSELLPGRVETTAPGVAEVARRRDGHFSVDATADGARLNFMFDTGASTVVIRGEDAGKLGLDPARLRYDTVVSTANGVTRAAQTLIRTMTVGSIRVDDVRATVARPGTLHENLLGQSFLEKLAGYSVENGRLVMRAR
jgi:aspartyl protease family protein